LRSNQAIGLAVASRLTAVGLIRQSIGPAIRVRLAGVASCRSSDISAVAASAATHGWQTATTLAAGPQRREEVDQVRGVLVEPEAALGRRHVAHVVPVGDVDVVVDEQGAHRVAQQGREVARHRRDDEHLGLGGAPSLRKRSRVAKGVACTASSTTGHGLAVDRRRCRSARPAGGGSPPRARAPCRRRRPGVAPAALRRPGLEERGATGGRGCVPATSGRCGSGTRDTSWGRAPDRCAPERATCAPARKTAARVVAQRLRHRRA
jgi:hypothetical protein